MGPCDYEVNQRKLTFARNLLFDVTLKEKQMSKQKSQKSGKQSTAQKFEASRHNYDPIPATSKVDGAFGDREPTTQSDIDASMILNDKQRRREASDETIGQVNESANSSGSN